MKHVILIALAVLIFAGCEKEEMVTADVQSLALDAGTYDVEMAKRGKADKVDICHYDEDTDTYKLIRVSKNAKRAHLAHGDQEVDADGDGFTAVGSCVGSADDCDDLDPDVNPGAEEICDNGIDDDCDGDIDEGCGPVFPEAWVGETASINNPPGFIFNSVKRLDITFISDHQIRFNQIAPSGFVRCTSFFELTSVENDLYKFRNVSGFNSCFGSQINVNIRDLGDGELQFTYLTTSFVFSF